MPCDNGSFHDLDRLLPATRTTRPEVARSHLAAIFADHDLRLSAGSVDFSHRQATLCDAAIGMLRYGTEVEVVAPALECYVAQFPLDGEVAFRTERFETVLKPGTLFVMNPGLRYRKTWSRDAQQLMIKIPRRRLSAHAGRPVRFAHVPVSIRETDGLVELVTHICRDLANERGLSAYASLRREMEDLLLSGLIATQTSSGGEPGGPGYLRRAEAHIQAHPGRSVSLPELVALTGVSERTLQQAFRRHRDCTPLELSRDVRLDAARAAMLSQPDACVTATALEFGFQHFGRFAQSYAARFGEKPSETVKRRAKH